MILYAPTVLLSQWHERTVCKCGWHVEGRIPTIQAPCNVCPKCEANLKTSSHVEIMKLKFNHVWWNPLTWFTGEWKTYE